MMKGILRSAAAVAFLFLVFNASSQQLYSWEEQAKEIVVQAEELLPDTTQQVNAFKESLQSLVRESFQVADSYKLTSDSLQKALTDLQTVNDKYTADKKNDEKLKIYFLGGAGAIVLILLVLAIIFAIISGKVKSRYKKAAAELKELNSAMAKSKEEAGQTVIKIERLDTELKDCLQDIKALDGKNKELIKTETDLKCENAGYLQQINDLKQKLTVSEGNFSAKTGEIETLTRSLQEVKNKLSSVRAECDNLKQDIELLRNQKDGEIAVMSSQIVKKESLIAACEKEFETFKANAGAELEAAKKLSESAGPEIAALRSELAEANKHLEDKEAEISVLKSEVEETKKRFAVSGPEFEALKVENHSLLEKTDLLQKEADDALQMIAQSKSVTDSLHTEKQNMAAEMTSLYNQSLVLEGENRSLKAEIETLKMNIEKEVQARVRIDRELEKFVEELKGFLPLP